MLLTNALSFVVLAYVYLGYYLTLMMLKSLLEPDRSPPRSYDAFPRVTVILAVYNEERQIVERVRNILESDYPKQCLELLIASDGSTDRTDELASSLGDDRVRVIRTHRRGGKSAAQNNAVPHSTGAILLFTDADTRFARGTLTHVAQGFSDPKVGGVTGRLVIKEEGEAVHSGQARYWKVEHRVRQVESALGILAVGAGCCIAVRRSLFKVLPEHVGEDCVLPLQVVSSGAKMAYVADAVAWDSMPSTPGAEFKSRVRMTMRNWQGTWLYPDLLNPLSHPAIAWALWSHKVLRWLSPFFMIGWLLSSGLLLLAGGDTKWLGVPGLILLLGALTGGASVLAGRPLRLASEVFGFMVTNAGFLVGVLKAVFGRRIATYR